MIENSLQIEEGQAEEVIKQRIFIIRKRRVMIDTDLAKLYGVLTKDFNRAVKRNINRFPDDFMFQLTEDENLRCQIGTSSLEYGGRRYLPYVFTEHGIAMLSSVLNSERAIQMNIFIIRAFIRMRELTVSNNELSLEIEIIKSKQNNQDKIIANIQSVVTQMIERPIKKKSKIGFNEGK